MSKTNLSDTGSWLPLDGLAVGFDANKAEPTTALAGRNFGLTGRNGDRVGLQFSDQRFSWQHSSAASSGAASSGAASSGEDSYEAVEVDTGLYYVQYHRSDRPEKAVSLFLDDVSGRALLVRATIGEPGPGRTAVTHEFVPAVIDGAVVTGSEPAPTTTLIGRRALWVYSEEHAYEHVYLTPHWYSWLCLAGPERGQADTDENTVYELRRGIYVFTWREKIIPCGSVTVADHRDASALRSHGYLFGLDETGSRSVHFTFGAFGRLLSTTLHPDRYSPAQA